MIRRRATTTNGAGIKVVTARLRRPAPRAAVQLARSTALDRIHKIHRIEKCLTKINPEHPVNHVATSVSLLFPAPSSPDKREAEPLMPLQPREIDALQQTHQKQHGGIEAQPWRNKLTRKRKKGYEEFGDAHSRFAIQLSTGIPRSCR